MQGILDVTSSDTQVRTKDSSAGLTEEDLKVLQRDLVQFKEKELVARNIWTVNSDTPAWAKTAEYDEVDDKVYRDSEDNDNDEFTSDNSTEFMMVDEDINRKSNRILRRMLGAEMDSREVEAARAMGRDIRTRKTTLLRRAHFRFEERLVWLGSNLYNIPGAATVSGAQTLNPLNSNAWNSGTKAAEDILDDVDRLLEQLNNQEGFMAPWDLALPLDRHALLARTRIAPDQGDTRNLLEIIEDNPLVRNVEASSDLQDTNGSGQHTAMAIDGDPENGEILTPEILNMRDPWELKNENILLRARITTGGVTIFDLNSLVQMDGV